MQSPNCLKNISEAVRGLLMGQTQAAERQLLSLKGEAVKGTPMFGTLPLRYRWKVFQRDQFTCRHCYQKTVFLPVLVALSVRYPQTLPYDPQNSNALCHRVFWHATGVADLARPGLPLTPENLITACYPCHQAKLTFPDPVRWFPKPIAVEKWDGLSGQFSDLCEFTGVAALEYFFDWLKIVRGDDS